MIADTMCVWELILWSWIFIATAIADVQIQVPLTDMAVIQGDIVEFMCKVLRSPAIADQHVNMKWKHNGNVLDLSSSSNKYKLKDKGQVLVIQNVNRFDKGDYTCIASVGAYKDRSTANLSVRTTPDPPKNVRIMGCSGQQVEIMWNEGYDGGSEILSYLVQYNNVDIPEFWNNYYEECEGKSKVTTVHLSPWGKYSFRMLARNEIGYSDPSQPADHMCETPPTHPDGNPQNVRTLTHKKKKLIIAWQPMSRIFHNAPGLKYRVYWRPKGSTYWKEEVVDKSSTKQLEIDVDDIYRLYEIKVKAFNDMGPSRQPPFIRLGHSGEAEPLVSPKDFRLDPTAPTEAHKAHFIWESVDTSEEKIRGKFRGYKLRYWKSSEGRHHWTEVDIIVDMGEGQNVPDVRATIGGLPANTALRAQVAVMNGHYTGPPSQTIEVDTPEGVPGPVKELHLEAKGTNFVVLKWRPPEELNGKLVGYDIAYQTVDGNSPVIALSPKIKDPNTLGARISGLKPNLHYRFYVWARTGTGRGDPVFLDIRTSVSSTPEIPKTIKLAVDEDRVNVTWKSMPDLSEDIQFLIEYRREGASDWTSTDTTTGRSWKLLNGLHPNTKYEFRLVAMNRVGQTKNGPNFSVLTDPRQGGAHNGQVASIHQKFSIASRNMSQNLAVITHILVTLFTFLFVFH